MNASLLKTVTFKRKTQNIIGFPLNHYENFWIKTSLFLFPCENYTIVLALKIFALYTEGKLMEVAPFSIKCYYCILWKLFAKLSPSFRNH